MPVAFSVVRMSLTAPRVDLARLHRPLPDR